MSHLEPPFVQPPPELGNQYHDDRVLRSYLARALPPAVLAEIEDSLADLGALAGGDLYRLQLADLASEPRLLRRDAWGREVDEVVLTDVWRRAERLAAERGVVATAYEAAHGALSRIHQFALAHLFTPATDIYSCPLAMTDGAARTLLDSGNRRLIERALPRLTSRDPARFWTSGQWMTEATGGSDVGLSRTVARRDEGGWRLWGHKWFTSAVTSQMALTLARPEGNGPGGRGLALFYLETRDPAGGANGIRVHRLKDKLGTRKLPTAEISLDGTRAELVGETTGGVKAIAPMLNITRTWNAISAVSLMRRGIALARDYARRRVAFGAPLAEKPLHLDTLAGLQAEYEGAFHLTFRVIELLGRMETGEASEGERELLRILTPITKLTTARQAVTVSSEVLEAFGGAGYLEDTGLPALLRDAQVLTIWEGTTNVLALDALRALGEQGEGLARFREEVDGLGAGIDDPGLRRVWEEARQATAAAGRWLEAASGHGRPAVEAGARRFALTLGRALEAALLARHAGWSLANEEDGRAVAAARRLAAHGLDRLVAVDPDGSQALANDRPLPRPAAVST